MSVRCALAHQFYGLAFRRCPRFSKHQLSKYGIFSSHESTSKNFSVNASATRTAPFRKLDEEVITPLPIASAHATSIIESGEANESAAPGWWQPESIPINARYVQRNVDLSNRPLSGWRVGDAVMNQISMHKIRGQWKQSSHGNAKRSMRGMLCLATLWWFQVLPTFQDSVGWIRILCNILPYVVYRAYDMLYCFWINPSNQPRFGKSSTTQIKPR